MSLAWLYKITSYLFPSISVHVWGGVGSQLFALCLLLDLENRFKFRKVKLVFHNSGVTKRDLGLDYSFITNKILSIDDFDYVNNHKISDDIKKSYLKLLMFKCATSLGIFSQVNTTIQYKNLKPWILIIRGHYSYRFLSSKTLLQLIKLLKNSSDLKFQTNLVDTLAIHYRLGDLLYLKEKTYISEERIKSLLNDFSLSGAGLKLLLYSDSPNEALNKIKKLSSIDSIELRYTDPVSTIFEICNAKKFIGTNSKITLWCVILRNYINNNSLNFVPEELKENLILVLPDIEFSQNTIFY